MPIFGRFTANCGPFRVTARILPTAAPDVLYPSRHILQPNRALERARGLQYSAFIEEVADDLTPGPSPFDGEGSTEIHNFAS